MPYAKVFPHHHGSCGSYGLIVIKIDTIAWTSSHIFKRQQALPASYNALKSKFLGQYFFGKYAATATKLKCFLFLMLTDGRLKLLSLPIETVTVTATS